MKCWYFYGIDCDLGPFAPMYLFRLGDNNKIASMHPHIYAWHVIASIYQTMHPRFNETHYIYHDAISVKQIQSNEAY